MRLPLRWLAIGIFLFSSALNYLDRQLLAAVAPALKGEFHLSNQDYGKIVSVFSLLYAAVAPLAGWFIDRVGLNAGATIAVLTWSLAGASTALAHSVRGVLASRTALGIAEAAGIPCFGKANGIYLEPSELAIGTACNQIGISLGMTVAPLLVAAIAPFYGWRATFVVGGALGLIWVPLWLFTAGKIPAHPEKIRKSALPIRQMLRDRRFWGMVISTLFMMSLYTLWTNWTTLYYVEHWRLTQQEANARYAWIPPVFGIFGGFAGGWMAFRWIRGGLNVVAARLRACWIFAVAALLATAAIPLMPGVIWATAAVSISAFWALGATSNLYALPIDLFGPGRAGVGVAALTSAYGLMQVPFSLAIGAMVDHAGFSAVFFSMSALPLIGVAILWPALRP
jgi:MFS transporter, ACS family, hexuronate transporter